MMHDWIFMIFFEFNITIICAKVKKKQEVEAICFLLFAFWRICLELVRGEKYEFGFDVKEL